MTSSPVRATYRNPDLKTKNQKTKQQQQKKHNQTIPNNQTKTKNKTNKQRTTTKTNRDLHWVKMQGIQDYRMLVTPHRTAQDSNCTYKLTLVIHTNEK